MGKLPLEGVRVLDLSRVLAGPLCTMMLGDLGATVIKVERPGTGDETRGWGPPFRPDGQSAYFLSVNRNKFSVAVDFANPDDQALLHALLEDADIVVENFLPGALAKYGLDADLMLRRHQRLIWCTIGGFDPPSSRPGYDFVVQAESGWMAITGEPDGAPMKAGVAMVDVTAGKDAAIGILAALASRNGSASPLSVEDRFVRVTLESSARAALVNVAANVLVSGQDARRWGNAHANLVPYQLFEASDRPFVIAVGSDPQWTACARALGLDELATDATLITNAGRLAARTRIVEAIATRVATAPAAEWIARLDAAGVPCGVVRSVREALADVTPQEEGGMPPLWNGRVRLAPPTLDHDGVSIRAKYWSCDDHMPIPPDMGV